MDIRDLELSRPCPIDLDSLGVDRSQAQVFCSHCQTQVTDISKMPEAAAAAFVRENRGKGVCISYLRDAKGNVRFAEPKPDPKRASVVESPLVPVERLGHPRLRRAAAVAALTLAACTPHRDKAEIDAETAKQARELLEMNREPRTLPELEILQEPYVPEVPEVPEVPVGQLIAEPPAEVEPCETTVKNNRAVRGRLRVREPAHVSKRTAKKTAKKTLDENHDWDRIEGGI